MSNIIPFGKHKGKTIDEVRVIDPQYLDWLSEQPWFREKNIILYQTIVNYSNEPTETPEHNALQVLFLDDAFCVRFAEAAKGKKYQDWFEMMQQNELRLLRSVPATLAEERAHIIASHAKRREDYKKELDQGRKFYERYLEENRQQEQHLIKELDADLAALDTRIKEAEECTMVVTVQDREFEAAGLDVFFRILTRASPPYISHWHRRDEGKPPRFHAKGEYGHMPFNDQQNFPIEIKPTIGDDYPAVLRQVRRSGASYLFLGSYTGQGASREQFIATMASAKIKVVFAAQIGLHME